MKTSKLLTILLLIALCLSLTFALASCRDVKPDDGASDDGTSDGGKDDSAAPADIYAIANKSTATAITTSVGYAAEDGTEFNAWYVAKRQGNDMIIEYEFERYRTIEESVATGDTSRFVKEEGVVYYLDGKYYNSYDESKTPWVDAPLDVNFKFNVSKDKFSSVYAPSETVLYGAATPEACEDMFGIKIECKDSISVYMATNGVQIIEMQFVYTTDSGAVVTVFTTYSYNDLELDFTPITGEDEEEAA